MTWRRPGSHSGFRAARQALNEFDPDFVLMFGDDQYENFKEDIIPAAADRWVFNAAQELNMRSIQLTCAIANPQHVRRRVIPIACR